MTRNLEVETYCNGDTIPEVTDPSAWSKLTTGAWCYYNNDPAMGEIYGKLYNWYAVNDPRGLAPLGWHIPSDEEWKVLEMCLGMSVKEVEKIDQWRGRNEGGKLKCTGTFEGGDGLWYSPNTDATNITGFSINPGGSRSILSNWNYDRLHWNCHFWTSTEFYSRHFAHDLGSIGRYISNKSNGYTIRCVKD